MFLITSGQLPFIIQYLQKAHVRLGLGGLCRREPRAAAAGHLLSPSLLTASQQGPLALEDAMMDGGTVSRQEPSEAWPVGLKEDRLLSLSCSKTCKDCLGLLGQGQAPRLALETPPTRPKFCSFQHLYSVLPSSSPPGPEHPKLSHLLAFGHAICPCLNPRCPFTSIQIQSFLRIQIQIWAFLVVQ